MTQENLGETTGRPFLSAIAARARLSIGRGELMRFAAIALAALTIVLGVTNAILVIAQPSPDAGLGMLSLGKALPTSLSPLFMVEKGPDAQYLRGAVGVFFDGREWKLEKTFGENLELVIHFERNDLPLHPNEVARDYQQFDMALLRSCPVLSDEACLALPEDITLRTRELAVRITEGQMNAFEKALAIETYLRMNYRYDPDFRPAPANWEPNDWFLFESGEGVCGNFASAFVVLARAAGLPARLAAGYFVAPGEGEQFIYADQAHGWAEVGFEGVGWIVFDAT